MLLQLGYLLDGPDAAGQILFPSDNHITIYTHNDNTIHLSEANFNHHSGIKLPDSESPANPNSTVQILSPSADYITLWIHNDNAIQLLGSTFNHYSGVELPPSESSFEFGSIPR